MKKTSLIKVVLIVLACAQSAFASNVLDSVQQEIYQKMANTPDWSQLSVPEKRQLTIDAVPASMAASFFDALEKDPQWAMDQLASGSLEASFRIAIYKHIQEKFQSYNTLINTMTTQKIAVKSDLVALDMISHVFVTSGMMAAGAVTTQVVGVKKFNKNTIFHGRYAPHMVVLSVGIAVVSFATKLALNKDRELGGTMIHLHEDSIARLEKTKQAMRPIFLVLESQLASAADQLILEQSSASKGDTK